MVNSDVMKITTTCSLMTEHLFDIILLAATDEDL